LLEYPPGRRTNRFVWRELITKELDTAIKFYTELFGWDIRPKDYGSFIYQQIFLNKDSDYLIGGMITIPHQPDLPSTWLSYVSVPNMDEAVKVRYIPLISLIYSANLCGLTNAD
jgi:predicted enzyme related to lactoylglutathione lyase